MTKLSPAAQAAINAAVEVTGYGKETPLLCAQIASALRAAADQVVPVPINAQTPDEHWALLGVKNRLLAIADELEAQYSDQLVRRAYTLPERVKRFGISRRPSLARIEEAGFAIKAPFAAVLTALGGDLTAAADRA